MPKQASMGREFSELRLFRNTKDPRDMTDKELQSLMDERDSEWSSSTDSDRITALGAVPADEVEKAVAADFSALIRNLMNK